MWPDQTRLGIKDHLLLSIRQRPHLSRGDYSLNRQKGQEEIKGNAKGSSRTMHIAAKACKVAQKNPNGVATVASTGYLTVRSCNSHVLPGDQTPKVNLQSTASGERWILLSCANAWAVLLFQARDLGLQKKELL